MVVLFVEEENGFPHFRSTRRVTPAHETTVADCGGFVGTGNWWRGKAVDDRRQGCGRKRYVNGDYYEGEWHRNLQQGKGRYVWRNGNQYVGEWKNGVISGRGVLIWANGNRYDGHWDNGVPKGNGVFTWPDGSCYVMDSSSSSFSSSSSHFSSSLHGTFYSSFKSTPDFMKQSTVDVTTGRGSYSGEKHFPRICIWESDGVAGDITCDIIDALQASLLYKDGTDAAATESKEQKRIERQNNTPWSFAGDDAPKKPGRTITKDHKKYDLMRNLQLGISCSVGKSATTREIRTNDFNQKQKFWTRFPAEGSKMTPPHTSTEFRWKDYCPMLFRHLRKLFGVDPTDYILAICGNGALRELSSPGKSGSFFYLTQDDRFMIKTVKKSEAKVLMKMLPAYYNHVTHHSNTLLTRFFGVHCVKPIGGQKVRFVVMGNFFRPSEHRIHRRFDLKGSRHGRSASTEKIDETTTLKDLDLNLVFKVEPTSIQALLGQIEADCGFLEAERIMDYSLLIGLHFHDDNSAGLETTRGSWKMAARAEVVSNGWGFERSGDVYDVIKSLHVDPTTISAVDPKLYSRRFRDFVRRIFVLEKTDITETDS